MHSEGPGPSGGTIAELRNSPPATHDFWPLDLAWRGQVRESAVEADLPILDAQHHLSSPANFRYPGRGYGVDDLIQDVRASGHKIVGTIYVDSNYHYRTDGSEAMRSVGEVEHVVGEFARARRVAPELGIGRGIVGHAELLLGDEVAPVLEALVAAGQGRLKGIRDVVAWDPDSNIRFPAPYGAARGMMSDPRFQHGFSLLARHNLTFNALVFHPQLAELEALAQQHAAVTIVIDHIGMPIFYRRFADRRDEAMAEWRNAMARLARLPNVYVKIGAMISPRLALVRMAPDIPPPTSDHLATLWKPLVETCIELFTPRRSILESDYTVARPICDYTVLWNTMKKLTRGYSADERAWLFAGAAEAAYRLDPV
ncbi:MAG: amidohydrolase family protein [Rhodospirillales bacterium]|nr:amidohydrolase family protein [Rhodospirillales bacterium]